MSYRQIDWKIVVDALVHSGKPLSEIEHRTGLTQKRLTCIKEEKCSTDELTRAVNLLLLFLDKTEYDVPIIGEFTKLEEMLNEQKSARTA